MWCTSFVEARSLGGFLASSQTTLVVIGVLSGMPAGYWKQPYAWLALVNPRQCSRSAASSFGLSITSRSFASLATSGSFLEVTA